MANAVRGESSVEIAGKTYRLCLTLGVLAELETSFGCASIEEFKVRLRRLSSSEMLTVLEALLRGGRNPVERCELAGASLSPAQAAKAIAGAFHAALV